MCERIATRAQGLGSVHEYQAVGCAQGSLASVRLHLMGWQVATCVQRMGEVRASTLSVVAHDTYGGWLAQVAALRKEAAKWQELEESKTFLETQVAQMRAREAQEASKASTLAAQARAPAAWLPKPHSTCWSCAAHPPRLAALARGYPLHRGACGWLAWFSCSADTHPLLESTYPIIPGVVVVKGTCCGVLRAGGAADEPAGGGAAGRADHARAGRPGRHPGAGGVPCHALPRCLLPSARRSLSDALMAMTGRDRLRMTALDTSDMPNHCKWGVATVVSTFSLRTVLADGFQGLVGQGLRVSRWRSRRARAWRPGAWRSWRRRRRPRRARCWPRWTCCAARRPPPRSRRAAWRARCAAESGRIIFYVYKFDIIFLPLTTKDT